MTTIRLACMVCDREDYDGITPEQLAQALLDGWQGIDEAQTYEEATAEIGNGFSGWWTHLGWCPECAARDS